MVLRLEAYPYPRTNFLTDKASPGAMTRFTVTLRRDPFTVRH
jgi:hypothetical protein